MRHFLLAAAALSVAAAAPAQQAAPAASADRLKADIEFLADDLLEGRAPGERGYDIAAHYVATSFAALGLTPGNGDSWFQEVPFREARLVGPARLTIDDTAFAAGKDVMIGPSVGEERQVVEAPVVFVGFGLDAPERGLDDYAGLDVKWKIVAVLSGFPKGMPSDVGAHLNAEKSKMAEARGAIGIVTIPTRELEKAVPFERILAYGDGPAMAWIEADGTPHQKAPGIRASAILGRKAAGALFAGAPKTLEALLDEADREGGRPEGFALDKNVKIERTSRMEALTSPNVLGVLPGSDPALADEYVVLMGHLDHDGIDPDREGDKIFNGAMDNAAGIATMLEVARAFARSGERPKRSILFAAVTAEETGLLGSQYLARHPVGKPVAVVNLDMPVLLYDFTDVVAFGAEHSTLGPIVAGAAEKAGVTLSPDPMPEQGIFTRSDHYRFVQAGVPSVMLMTGFANGGGDIWRDFFATHYHKVSDEPDLPFDWNAAAKFARINYLIARDIADAPQAPRWYAESFFGDTFAPAQAKVAKGAQ